MLAACMLLVECWVDRNLLRVCNWPTKNIDEHVCLLRVMGAVFNLEYSGLGDVV